MLESPIYKNIINNLIKEIDLQYIHKMETILIPGGTGLLGSCITDILDAYVSYKNIKCKIYVMTRNKKDLKSQSPNISYIETDYETVNIDAKFDFIINCASEPDPKKCIKQPFITLTDNINTTLYTLKLLKENGKYVYISTSDVYTNYKDAPYVEDDPVIYNPINKDAIYRNSKIISENLIYAYAQDKDINYVVARCCHIFGPKYNKDDDRLLSQLFYQCIKNKIFEISETVRNYNRSHIFVVDAARSILELNIANETVNIYDKSLNLSIGEFCDRAAILSKAKITYKPSTSSSVLFKKVRTHSVLSSIHNNQCIHNLINNSIKLNINIMLELFE